MPKPKTYFPQVPLEELKHILPKRIAGHRAPNLTVHKRKGNEPYSVPVGEEAKYGR